MFTRTSVRIHRYLSEWASRRNQWRTHTEVPILLLNHCRRQFPPLTWTQKSPWKQKTSVSSRTFGGSSATNLTIASGLNGSERETMTSKDYIYQWKILQDTESVVLPYQEKNIGSHSGDHFQNPSSHEDDQRAWKLVAVWVKLEDGRGKHKRICFYRPLVSTSTNKQNIQDRNGFWNRTSNRREKTAEAKLPYLITLKLFC